MPQYYLALVTDKKYWGNNKNLIIIHQSIIDHNNYFSNNYFSRNNFNIRFIPRLTKNKQDKYIKNVDFFVKKKFLIYKKQLISILNRYHNISNNHKYWDKIIASWLFDVITVIKFRFDDLSFVKKKVKNNYFLCESDEKFNYINNSYDFFSAISESSKINHFLYLKIADILKIKKKIIYNNSEVEKWHISNAINFKNFFIFITFYFYNLYVKFFKPIILIDSYFCFRDKIKIIFLSKGKILFPKSSYFFQNNLNAAIDKQIRSKIQINEQDLFDKTFNSLLPFLIPMSFLENFNLIRSSILNYSKNINIIGSAVCFYSSDCYKILTAEMLKYKKKPLIFAHGHSDKLSIYDSKFNFELKNISKHIAWNDKNGFGVSNLRRLNNYSSSSGPKKFITLFTTTTYKYFFKILFPIKVNNHKEVLNENINFYICLKKNIKSKFLLKPHLDMWCKEKEIWYRKFGKELNINLSVKSKNVINQSKIIVTGYISVSTFESLYLDKPTIIFCNLDDYFFKKEHLFFFKKLSNAKILHKNAHQAANFINDNYSDIERWWQSKQVRDVIYIIKNKYCVDNDKFSESLINCLIYKKFKS